MPSKTKQTAYRLSDDTLAHLALIAEHWGLPSGAAAVRVAARKEFENIMAERAAVERDKAAPITKKSKGAKKK